MKSKLTAFQTLERDSAQTPILWKLVQFTWAPVYPSRTPSSQIWLHPGCKTTLTFTQTNLTNLTQGVRHILPTHRMSDKSTLHPSGESLSFARENKCRFIDKKKQDINIYQNKFADSDSSCWMNNYQKYFQMWLLLLKWIFSKLYFQMVTPVAGGWWHWAVWAGMARWDFYFYSL